MLTILASVALASAPSAQPVQPTRATAQARATVRIVSAVTVRLGEGPLSGDAPLATQTVVRADGSHKPARLIEFE
jgi:hypothetical protein